MKEMKKERIMRWGILGMAVIIYLMWTNVIPFNRAPDEYGRYLVPQFIFENGCLPQGGEESVRIPGWGFSYALTPILGGIISSIFMKAYSIIGGNTEQLYLAARLASVCCGVGTVYFMFKIGKETVGERYKYICASLIAFWPQFTFISAYVNNDIVAVFSISIIVYYWIQGIKSKWSFRACIGLGIGISICALSYYNAYGFILCSMILFIKSNLLMQQRWKEIFKRGGIIAVIVIILSGWWFMRNGIIHNGDILGLKSVTEYSNLYGLPELQPANRDTPHNLNESLLYMLKDRKWIDQTYKSFIGVFDYMNIYVYNWIYKLYGILMLIKIVTIATRYKKSRGGQLDDPKQNLLFEIMLILAGVISITLSLIYSYYTDFQPQGRYIMGCIIPLIYFITLALKSIDEWLMRHKINLGLPYIIVSIMTIVNIICLTKILFPSYFVISKI